MYTAENVLAAYTNQSSARTRAERNEANEFIVSFIETT